MPAHGTIRAQPTLSEGTDIAPTTRISLLIVVGATMKPEPEFDTASASHAHDAWNLGPRCDIDVLASTDD